MAVVALEPLVVAGHPRGRDREADAVVPARAFTASNISRRSHWPSFLKIPPRWEVGFEAYYALSIDDLPLGGPVSPLQEVHRLLKMCAAGGTRTLLAPGLDSEALSQRIRLLPVMTQHNLVEVREHDSLAYAPAVPDPQNWWRARGSNPHAEDVSPTYFLQSSPLPLVLLLSFHESIDHVPDTCTTTGEHPECCYLSAGHRKNRFDPKPNRKPAPDQRAPEHATEPRSCFHILASHSDKGHRPPLGCSQAGSQLQEIPAKAGDAISMGELGGFAAGGFRPPASFPFRGRESFISSAPRVTFRSPRVHVPQSLPSHNVSYPSKVSAMCVSEASASVTISQPENIVPDFLAAVNLSA